VTGDGFGGSLEAVRVRDESGTRTGRAWYFMGDTHGTGVVLFWGHARDGRGTLFFDGEVGVFPAAEAVV
jgi:hypothetical protein